MNYKFYTCDVFTDTRFGGNPLAVFPHAEGLTSEQMQLIAREFNYSETTFVLPSKKGLTRQVRIFTPKYEMPFAGHPNVGTAFTLATIGELGEFESETAVTFDELAGPVPITIRQADGMPIWCELEAPQPLSLGKTLPIDLVAHALSLPESAIVSTNHPPRQASVGTSFIMVELQDRSALEKARPNIPVFDQIATLVDRPPIHLYTHSNDDFDIRARMFAPLGGTFEDPATGSANCNLAGLLTHLKPESDGQFSWRIAQGVEMGRPSILDARTEKVNGEVTAVYIAGTSVMVSEGVITV